MPDGEQEETLAGPPDATGRPADAALAPLRRRYELLGELGRGGMGIVYRARDRETGDIVALKILQPEIAALPGLIDRFKAELLLARKITHKNVCRVYDLNRFDGVAAISMEYVEGESLRKLLGRVEGLSLRHGLNLLRQVLAGLAEAHAQGVVHRDLKPENVLIARDGTVKVMDFGIARSLESGATATATATGMVIGTPAYMSPEQAAGRPVDHRSDIYSLGLILYEMFTGRRPFEAESPVAIVAKQIHDTPPPPRDIEPYLPAFLDRATLKCLEKDPKKRFQSVAELEAALFEETGPAPVTEGEPVPAAHLSRWHGFDWALLFVGIFGLLYFWLLRDEVFPASQMRLQLEAVAARRTAEEWINRLGQPAAEPRRAQTQLLFRTEPYELAVLDCALDTSPERSRACWSDLSSRWPGEPLAWQVGFTGPLGDKWGLAVIDAKGKVERLNPTAWVPGGYQPPPIDERRAKARQAVELACGTIPADYVMRETSGGESGASYSATWKKKDVPRRRYDSILGELLTARVYQVSLVAERVADLRCRVADEEWKMPWHPGRPGLWVMATLGGVLLIVLFILSRAYRVPWLWRRLPQAMIVALIGEWAVHAAIGWPDIPLAIYLMELFAATGLSLIGLVTAEDQLRRRVPEKIASYVLAFRGRFAESSVGLAVFRGALAGVTLAAFETLLAHLTQIAQERMVVVSEPAKLALFVMLSPAPVAQAISSLYPGLFAVAVALFDGVLVGLVYLGLLRALLFRRFQRAHGSWLGYLGAITVLALPLWFTGGHFTHLAQFIFPSVAFVWVLLLEAIFLAWLLERYDVLTVIMAVSTFVLWTINYPLLRLFSEVGNTPQWAVFSAWAVAVLLAAALAFRASLDRARQRLVAGFE